MVEKKQQQRCNVLESVVISAIHKLLILLKLDYQIWRNNVGSMKNGKRWITFGQAGLPDFIGYDKKGRFIGIECKRPKGGRLSEVQKQRIEHINACGGVAFVVTSADEALQKLKERDCI